MIYLAVCVEVFLVFPWVFFDTGLERVGCVSGVLKGGKAFAFEGMRLFDGRSIGQNAEGGGFLCSGVPQSGGKPPHSKTLRDYEGNWLYDSGLWFAWMGADDDGMRLFAEFWGKAD